MSFYQRHPFLFWQLIGWGILLADAAFIVCAAMSDWGEWQYPVMVFTFIAGLFAVAASPFIVRFTRKRDVPQNDSAYTENIIRSKISAINLARKKGHEALAAFLTFFSIIFFIFAAFLLGEYVHLAFGFAAMVMAVTSPFIIVGTYYTSMTRKFFAVKNGEKLVDIYHSEDIKALYDANPRTIVGVGDLPPVLLNFFYNWLSYYLKNERLTLYRVTAPELCRDFTPAGFLNYGDVLICIPEEQLDLTKEKAALFKRECDIMGAFPFSFFVAVNISKETL